MRREIVGADKEIEFGVIIDPGELVQLEADWNRLWSNTSDPYVSQSFTWCELSWREVASRRGHQFFCVVGRSAEKVVLIWPMMISSSFGCRIVSPLGPEGSEYSLVLCASGSHEVGWMQRALDFVGRRSRADLIRLPYTPLQAPLGKALPMLKGARFSTIDRICWVSWEDVNDWQTYLDHVPQSRTRQRQRRRLAKQGDYRFELVEGNEKLTETVEWLLRYKHQWMEATGKTNAWLPQQSYTNFLRSQIASQNDASGLGLFRITLDGKIIAAALTAIAPARVEGLIKTHDPAWSKYSPGQQLDEDLIRWAFERRLIFDFRLGQEVYKEGWCNRFGSVTSLTAALTIKGALFVIFLHLKRVMQTIRSGGPSQGISPAHDDSCRE